MGIQFVGVGLYVTVGVLIALALTVVSIISRNVLQEVLLRRYLTIGAMRGTTSSPIRDVKLGFVFGAVLSIFFLVPAWPVVLFVLPVKAPSASHAHLFTGGLCGLAAVHIPASIALAVAAGVLKIIGLAACAVVAFAAGVVAGAVGLVRMRRARSEHHLLISTGVSLDT